MEPMTNDPVNYVRQGALIASALIMIQQTEVTCPKVNTECFRSSFKTHYLRQGGKVFALVFFFLTDSILLGERAIYATLVEVCALVSVFTNEIASLLHFFKALMIYIWV